MDSPTVSVLILTELNNAQVEMLPESSDRLKRVLIIIRSGLSNHE